MTDYNFGDIILIGFPHSDLQGVSKRPAIVLYDSKVSLVGLFQHICLTN
jgi:hypothetical protein